MDRFDVIFGEKEVAIDYHFCREDDCFGTNDTHGYTFHEAKKIVVSHLKERLEEWQAMSLEGWRRNNRPTEEEMDEDFCNYSA